MQQVQHMLTSGICRKVGEAAGSCHRTLFRLAGTALAQQDPRGASPVVATAEVGVSSGPSTRWMKKKMWKPSTTKNTPMGK